MNKKVLLITLCFLIILSGCNTATNNEANNQGGNDEITNNAPTDVIEPTLTPFIPTDIPGWPIYTQFIIDCKTSDNVVEGQKIEPDPGCDLWGANRYERPFNAQAQDQFYPDLDLLFMEVGQSGQWIYVRIAIDDHDPDSDTLLGSYGLEIDFDLDMRGDVLLLAHQPQESDGGTEWFFSNNEVWLDEDQDVGADTPKFPDKPDPENKTGYDKLLPNLGQVWSRSSKKDANPHIVEFAFKEALLENNTEFILTGWSYYPDAVEPEIFDLHDVFENQEAGDVYPAAAHYPSLAIAVLDNTCGMLIGGAENDDPSLCVNDPDTSWYIPRSDGDPDDCPDMDFEEFSDWMYAHNPHLYPMPYPQMLQMFLVYVEASNCDPQPTHTPPPPGDCDPMDFEEWKADFYATYNNQPQPYSLLLGLYMDYVFSVMNECETPTPPPPPDEQTQCEPLSFEEWKDYWYSNNPNSWPQPYSMLLGFYNDYLQSSLGECPTPTPNPCPPADFEAWKQWWYAQNPGSQPQPYSYMLTLYQDYLETADPECVPTPTPTPTPTATATRPPPPTWTMTPTNTQPPPPPPEGCYDAAGRPCTPTPIPCGQPGGPPCPEDCTDPAGNPIVCPDPMEPCDPAFQRCCRSPAGAPIICP